MIGRYWGFSRFIDDVYTNELSTSQQVALWFSFQTFHGDAKRGVCSGAVRVISCLLPLCGPSVTSAGGQDPWTVLSSSPASTSYSRDGYSSVYWLASHFGGFTCDRPLGTQNSTVLLAQEPPYNSLPFFHVASFLSYSRDSRPMLLLKHGSVYLSQGCPLSALSFLGCDAASPHTVTVSSRYLASFVSQWLLSLELGHVSCRSLSTLL